MKKSGLGLFTSIALTGLMLMGCSSAVHIEKDDSTNFGRYKTYSWITKEDKDQKTNSIIAHNIEYAVNDELAKAGWREVKNSPDLLLSYDILVERTVKESSSPVYSHPYSQLYYNPYTRRTGTIYYPSQFMGYDRDQQSVKEGTITISMLDTRTDRTVWQGWTTKQLNGNKITSRDVQNGVKSIFGKFDLAKR